MANSDGREALRGIEDEVFDLLAEALTPEKWAELLRALLERAVAKGKRDLEQKLANAVDMLVGSGADIEVRMDSRATPLHVAAGWPRLKALLALLKYGADVSAQDQYDCTPLHRAAANAGRQTAGVVDSLLRSGADEAILNDMGRAAADIVASDVEEENQLAEDVERVRELLANAPADRAWRRRGYLVLCRVSPHRMRQIQNTTSAHHADVEQTTDCEAELGRTHANDCGGGLEARPVGERGRGGWAEVMASVVGLREEGVFRTIVGFL